MKGSAALSAGLVGTLAVASTHEALRRITPDAPRMDNLDMELIRKALKSMNQEVPGSEQVQRWAVGGELVCDTAYYALVGMGRKKGVWTRGALLGLIAGATAVILPKPLGLSEEPGSNTVRTQLMTIGLYLIGGLAAAAAARLTYKS